MPLETPASITQRFRSYFDRDLAQKAAKSLSNGVEIEFKITSEPPETFTFTKTGGKNQIRDGAAEDAQLLFTLSPQAAAEILSDPATDIGEIGVNIMRLVVAGDANRRITVKFRAGFLSLFAKGYLGVVAAGGGAFASYLASRGLSGMGAIKAALKKLKAD